jgi:hypothetical protein
MDNSTIHQSSFTYIGNSYKAKTLSTALELRMNLIKARKDYLVHSPSIMMEGLEFSRSSKYEDPSPLA